MSLKLPSLPHGCASLRWLGQMGLLVQIGSTLLCIDYYGAETGGRNYPPPIPGADVRGVDAFLGTHNHSDHMDHISWKIWKDTCPEAKFLCPKVHVSDTLMDGIPESRIIGMDDLVSVQIGDVTVTAIPAAHEFLAQDPESGAYPCLQYILEGNGVRIWHAGDTLRYEGMLGRIRAFGHMDAALLPINGRDAARYRRNCIGNMTFQEAVDLAGEVNPGCVIPGHWDLFADNPGDPQAFRDYLEAKYPSLRCLLPERMAKVLIRSQEETAPQAAGEQCAI
ncbi:MAG: MBL fold metallo-hydrolase [Clostridia bacterium]|nr:MBL fold metallo-hydrolase [Clostridia bacterium]